MNEWIELWKKRPTNIFSHHSGSKIYSYKKMNRFLDEVKEFVDKREEKLKELETQFKKIPSQFVDMDLYYHFPDGQEWDFKLWYDNFVKTLGVQV